MDLSNNLLGIIKRIREISIQKYCIQKTVVFIFLLVFDTLIILIYSKLQGSGKAMNDQSIILVIERNVLLQ